MAKTMNDVVAYKPPKGSIEISVRISERFKIRVKLGLLFLTWAAYMLNTNIEVDKVEEKDGSD